MHFLLDKLKEHDPLTFLHSIRVAELSVEIAKQLELDNHDQKVLYHGGLFHDIGKLEIDPYILNKPEKLTIEEWKLIQQHPITGYEMLRKYDSGYGICYIALFHHERIDGSGYPFGMKKDDIPLKTQIVALAESFDAMISKRNYNDAKTVETAFQELISLKNVLYLPQVVDALVNCQYIQSSLKK